MAWIDLTGLGRYHEKIKAWIEKNKYVHPANHPATMIVQDNLNQFVSKEQKDKWNNKLDADANAASASKLNKAVRINGVEFDGTKDITISNVSETNVIFFDLEVPSNNSNIKIDSQYQLTQDVKICVFVDGIKLIKNKHYTIDTATNGINLIQSYSYSTNVEIIIFK